MESEKERFNVNRVYGASSEANTTVYGAGGGGAALKPPNPPTQDAYEAVECADRIHNLIDSIEDRVFQSAKLSGDMSAVDMPPRANRPLADMVTETRQRLESAESRLRNFLERL